MNARVILPLGAGLDGTDELNGEIIAVGVADTYIVIISHDVNCPWYNAAVATFGRIAANGGYIGQVGDALRLAAVMPSPI